MKITLDTNCIINLLDATSTSATSSPELVALVQYALSGPGQIAITTRVEADLLKDKNPARQAEMLRQLEMFPVIGTVGRFDVTQFDGGDIMADPKVQRLAQEIQQIVFPGLRDDDKRRGNKLNDIDHLVGHFINQYEVFVTDDKDILKKAEALGVTPGIRVLTPAACIAMIEAQQTAMQKQPLKAVGSNPDFHVRALRGRVTFDYSSNDHRFTIGDGLLLFETRWSKAGDATIHAYRDAPSIDAIALAREKAAITEIADAAGFDFSTRVRSPNIGQIVIWRNANGFYAATQIVALRHDGKGDFLTFDYVILEKGGADFSKR